VTTACIATITGAVLLCHPTVFCQEAVVTGPIVNVRSGPGTKHEILAKVKKDDRFLVLKVKGLWVQIEIDEETFEEIRVNKGDEKSAPEQRETWIYRRLIQFIGKPPDFEERQIDFQNWALDVIPVTYIEFKSDWKISVRLPPDKYASREHVRRIAHRMAQEYKRQTGYVERKVVVQVLRRNRVYATASD
jgi:hypothetical protein